MTFTGHNIRLPDGTETFPDAECLVEDSGRFRAAHRMLNLVFPGGLAGKTIADLGCLEGGHAVGFARLGMNATGFEIRESNFKNCLYVQSLVKLPNLTFVNADVNQIDRYGVFDAVWACGIFYHLDQPRSFLEKAAAACRRVIFLETHFTYEHRTPAADLWKLSDLCEHQGLKGRWYGEHEDIQRDQLEDLKWSAWTNQRSFWVQKEYLLELMHTVGFDIVLEQYDVMPAIIEGMKSYYHGVDRGLFVGIRSVPAGPTDRV
jgi:SAM-dependent methyltransferase